VRKKVEMEAENRNASEVTLEHVRACQHNFLKSMEDEIKGYQLETCFGASGCPNRIPIEDRFIETLEDMLKSRGLKVFLKSRVNGPLKLHHEFRVSVSDCPNACSRPQIADLGIIAAAKPCLREADCSQCGVCAEMCTENAINMTEEMARPEIDLDHCLFCGQCIKACPTETLVSGEQGYRVMVGGKLGRRPRLASEIPGVFSKEQTFPLIDQVLDFYFKHSASGERFGEILERVGLQQLHEFTQQLRSHSQQCQNSLAG
ncbi:MAG: 4Fe-4S dicluster domain-containing protein, partial [Desulfomonilaceae bacterium]